MTARYRRPGARVLRPSRSWARLMWMSVWSTVLLYSPAVEAGGWTQPEGSYYFKVWDRSLVGRRIYVTERTTVRLPERYQDHQLKLYGEYGLIDDLTLTVNATALGLAVYGDEQRVYTGGGAVGARYRLIEGSLSSAIEVQVGAQPSSGSLASGTVQVVRGSTVETETFEAQPSLGTAHASLDLQVGYGLRFLWMSGTAGIRGFTNSRLKPAVYVNGQIGWISSFGLVIDLHLNWYHSTGDIGPINVYGAAQTRYLGIGLGASWWLTDHVAINAGLDGVFFATANAATPALQIGMEFK